MAQLKIKNKELKTGYILSLKLSSEGVVLLKIKSEPGI